MKKKIKKIVVVMIIPVILITGNLKAQITIESSDMPSKGDTVRLSTGLNVDFIDFRKTGENYVWDFSGLMPIKQTVDTFLRITDTPYWMIFFMSSNLSKHLPMSIPIPGLPISNVYEYYKKSNSSFNYVGYGAMLGGLPLPLKYSSPDVVYKFPMNYGNSDSSTSGLSFGIDNLGYALINRYRKNSVDGWGTLITPYGTFDVLRLKSEVSEYDSIYVDSLNMGFPVHRNYTEYKWLSKNSKEPLIQVSSSSIGIVVTYIDSARNILNGIKEIEDYKINLFPNPANKRFSILFGESPNDNVSIKIVDRNGKKVFSEIKPVYRKKMDISLINKIPSGSYIVVLNWKKHIVTRKLIIVQ